jgi:hypothetical protein
MIKQKYLENMTAIFVAVLVLASLTTLAAATDSVTLLSGGNGAGTGGQTPSPNSTNDCSNQTCNGEDNPVCTQNCTQAGESGNSLGTCNNSECILPGGLAANIAYRNKTDVTPKTEMEQVQAGEPMLFRYRNMTLLMNCTQNCSLVVSADGAVTPKILGLSVENPENMTVEMNMYGSPLKGETVMERTLNFYLGIEPNNQQHLRGQIRLYINQTELQQELNREVNASRLTWMFWNTTTAQWQAVPSFIDANGYLVCNTDHFSEWTVSEIEETTLPAENLFDATNMAYIAVGIVVAVIVLVAVVTVFKKRK